MKEVATITVRQDPDEPQLKMRLYKGHPHFYISVESDDPRIPPFMPIRIRPTNVSDAKKESAKFLYIIRGVFRRALGKTPDLPLYMKESESGLIPEKWTVEKCSSAQVKGAEGNEEKSVQ